MRALAEPRPSAARNARGEIEADDYRERVEDLRR